MIPGIDAGFSRFKVAIPDKAGNPSVFYDENGQAAFPSVVYFSPEGEIVIGQEAVNAAYVDPDRVVFSWKRHMGTDDVLYTDGHKQYRARDILVIFLKYTRIQLEKKLGQVVNEVVISVPANYNDAQRQETIDAAREAGLKVLQLVYEPTAAALGNGVHKRGNQKVLVFDLGGGTFDVSILEVSGNNIRVLATDGIPHLGGSDVNKRLQDAALQHCKSQFGFIPTPKDNAVFFQDLETRIENLKATLWTKDRGALIVPCDGQVLKMDITRSDFDGLTKDIVDQAVQKALQILQSAGLVVGDIGEIIVVGGGSRMKRIFEEIERVFGKKPSPNVEMDYAAALGAVVAGRIECDRLDRAYTVGNVVLPPLNIHTREVTSHAIGVAVLNQTNDLVFSEMLPRNLPIPCEQTRKFRLANDKQKEALIELLQGSEDLKHEACLSLGEMPMDELPPSSILGRIEITFRLDNNGMLKASALDTVSGRRVEMELNYKQITGKN